LPRKFYENLFPGQDWARHFKTLKKHGLLREAEGLVRVMPKAVKAIRLDPAEVRACTEEWVKGVVKK
jgi:hypothetical protein